MAAQAAEAGGIGTVKLYFMVALPEETQEDRAAIAELVAELRRAAPRVRLEVALGPLTPKPHTPWEGLAMPPLAEVRRRCAEVRRALGRLGIAADVGSPRGALMQVALARGGQELGPVIVEAGRKGGDYAALRVACKGAGLRWEVYAGEVRERPWRRVGMEGCPTPLR